MNSNLILPSTNLLDLPPSVCVDHVLPRISAHDLGRLSQSCRSLRACCQAVFQREAQQLCRLDESTKLFSAFGIAVPPSPSSALCARRLLLATERRIAEIDSSQESEVDLNATTKFFQNIYEASLKKMLGQVAGVPENTSVTESTWRIRAWTRTPEAQQVRSLNLPGKPLFCLPREVCALSSLQALFLTKTSLFALPKEIGQLKDLRILLVDQNKLSCVPKNLFRPRPMMIDLTGNPLPQQETCRAEDERSPYGPITPQGGITD